MHFVILGSGAVGGYFGARLVESGQQVTFIARNQHLKAMQTKGLKLKSIKGDLFLPNVNVTENVNDIKNVDVIFISVKTFQLTNSIELIKPIIGTNTRIIPLLNGVNAIEKLIAAEVDIKHLYGGLAKIISAVNSPGVISHTGAEPHITLGNLSEVNTSGEYCENNSLEEIVRCLNNAGISARTTSNIQIALWRKFIFVAAWGALAAVIKKPIGLIRSHYEMRKLLINIIKEYALVACAQGVAITEGMITETINFIDSLPEHSETSMQRDITNQQPSEFNALVAYPYSLAKKHQLTVPTLLFCYTYLSTQELL